VRLLEVIGVALARVEVALSNIRHAYMLPRPSELFGPPGTGRRTAKVGLDRGARLAGGSNITLARRTPRELSSPQPSRCQIRCQMLYS
jgi:hypothetical protein